MKKGLSWWELGMVVGTDENVNREMYFAIQLLLFNCYQVGKKNYNHYGTNITPNVTLLFMSWTQLMLRGLRRASSPLER